MMVYTSANYLQALDPITAVDAVVRLDSGERVFGVIP